jgi:hypothetical protein
VLFRYDRSMRSTFFFLPVLGLLGCGPRVIVDVVQDGGGDGGSPVVDAGPDAIAEALPPWDIGPPTEIGPPPPPDCTPGDIETKKCGKCGKQIRVCSPSGWEPWRACTDELPGAACAVGETRGSTCGRCGVQTDLCDTTACTWIAGTCAGEGPCSPGDIEKTGAACSSGLVRTRTCSDKCAWSDWSACAPP